MTHVIVGAGQAGGWAAVAMRQAGYDGRILLIGDEPWRPYERPPLSKAVLTDASEPPIAYFHKEEHYKEQGIELLLGTTVTQLDAAGHRIRLSDGQSLDYDRLLLTAGGRARHLPIPGGDKALYLRTIEDARSIRARLATARHVVCVGAGVIGLEIASSARQRGAEVTVLEALPRAMGRSVSPEGAQFVEALHRNAGVALHFGVIVDAIEHSPSDGLRVTCRGGGEFVGDMVIAGVGMQRNLALAEHAGLALEGGIVVDEVGRSSAPDIYAAGDICSRYKFTHAADAMAQIVIQNALFPHPFGLGYASTESLIMPWCTFTKPEIAHVGLYEAEATKKGLEVETYTYKLDEVDRAILDGEEDGFARVHIQKGTDKILGATIVAAHAGDMINEFSVLMKAGAGVKIIASTIHPYPTQAEVNKKAVNLWRKAHFTIRTKTLLTRLFAWMRR